MMNMYYIWGSDTALSLVIQIKWKFHFTNSIPGQDDTEVFAYATAAQLSCHVQKVVEICLWKSGWEPDESKIRFL